MLKYLRNNFFGQNRSCSAGFTLIELIIYVAILAIVAGAMVGILIMTSQVGGRQSSSNEVTSQLNFVMQTIQRLVRSSSNVEVETGVNTTILKLRMQDSAKDPTIIALSGGAVTLKEAGAQATSLTNARVVVNSLNFQKISSYPGHDVVTIDITMTSSASNAANQIQRSLSSAVARASAATFDSDLVPGSAYSYNIGQVSSPWQRVIVGDGSSVSPSYTWSNNTGLGLFRAGADMLGISTAGAERLRIDSSGNVGIGIGAPTYQLQLSTNSAGKPGGGSWSNSSDIRLKTDIQPIVNALEVITKLRGVYFRWINPAEHGNQTGIQGGFIAQDILNLFPNWVSEIDPSGADKLLVPQGGKIKSLSLPFEFDALIVETIKEQQAQIKALTERVEKLEQRKE